MILPTKHENLKTNLLVVGADIISVVALSPRTMEDVFLVIKKAKRIELDTFYDAITFLWLAELIVLDGDVLTLTKN